MNVHPSCYESLTRLRPSSWRLPFKLQLVMRAVQGEEEADFASGVRGGCTWALWGGLCLWCVGVCIWALPVCVGVCICVLRGGLSLLGTWGHAPGLWGWPLLLVCVCGGWVLQLELGTAGGGGFGMGVGRAHVVLRQGPGQTDSRVLQALPVSGVPVRHGILALQSRRGFQNLLAPCPLDGQRPRGGEVKSERPPSLWTAIQASLPCTPVVSRVAQWLVPELQALSQGLGVLWAIVGC